MKRSKLLLPQLNDDEIIDPEELCDSMVRTHELIDLKTKSIGHLLASKSAEPLEQNIIHNTLSELSKLGAPFLNEDHALGKRRNKKLQLKSTITKQKIHNIVVAFINKLRRNLSSGPPLDFPGFQNSQQINFLDRNGLNLNEILDKVMAFMTVALMVVLVFVYTTSLVYVSEFTSNSVQNLQIFSLSYYIVEIFINLISVRSSNGRKLETLREISRSYMDQYLWIDSLNTLIIFLGLISQERLFDYLRLVILLKVPQCLDKIQKLQVVFIQNYYNQQYWSLIKVLIFNFCYAHILAVFLTSMAYINPEHNWMVEKGIQNSNWFEQYIWSYYWGTTIMLTVGFGDIVATTYQQAICLIFVQTFSCIALAYNINCVGTLIANIRAQDQEKSKNFKTFKKLAEKNNIPDSLCWRVNNFIEESVNIKKKFNVEEETAFTEKLPNGLKREFLKESNKAIFHNISFFTSLAESTLYGLAEKIQMHIYHPEEVLVPLEDNFNLLILRGGQIGYVARKPNCDHNEVVMDRIKVHEKENPFLISMSFLTRKRPIYEVKSLFYSVIYFLEYDRLVNILKDTYLDSELFFFIRDKSKHLVDEFQVVSCEHCKTKHTKFQCPRIHFIPIEQHVINKAIHSEKISKNVRNKNLSRIICPRYPTMLNFQDVKKGATVCELSIFRKNQENIGKTYGQFFIEGYKRVKTGAEDNYNEPGRGDLQRAFMTTTAEMIKEELRKALNSKDSDDEVWEICSDRSKNYKRYFPTDNPCNLQTRFNISRRLLNVVVGGLTSLSPNSLQFTSHNFQDYTISECSPMDNFLRKAIPDAIYDAIEEGDSGTHLSKQSKSSHQM